MSSFATVCLLSLIWCGAMLAQTTTVTGVNNESGSKTVFCPGGIVFIQGTNLGGNNAKVTVGGKPAFTLSGGATSIQVELPFEAATGATTLTVNNSAPFNITLQQYAPGIATDGQADNLVSAFHVSNQAPVTATFPASPNEQIAVVATGLGPTNPQIPTGQSPNDQSSVTVTLPTVSVGGKSATVSNAFLSPNNSPGFYLLIFTVPAATPNGNQGISVSTGGVTSEVAQLPVSNRAVIGTVANAASYIDPSLPNGGIAQGSIFVLIGNNLGPANISIAGAAFQSTTLNGTSVSVTVGNNTVSCPLYYTSAGQVAALLPSNTPTGTGTITVTFNGQTGISHPIRVVTSSPAIFTITSDGQGAGIVTYPDYSLVSVAKAANCGGVNTTCGAANPGDTIIIWTTGLGPISGGTDASGVGLGVNMSSLPLTVWLGNLQLQAIYQGRSGCCIGEDQVVVTLPANGLPTGCAVPLYLQVGDTISNSVAIPVAVGSRTCAMTIPAFPSSAVVQLSTGSGPFTYGEIDLRRVDNEPGFTDKMKGQFLKFTPNPGTGPFFMSYVDAPPPGTCQIYNNTNGGGNTPITILGTLDAGPQISVSGPNGTKSVPGSGGSYGGALSGGTYLSTPATYTVSAPGGADVPAFSSQISTLALPNLSSPPPDAANPTTVTRANGMTITWGGGATNTIIEVDGFSFTDQTFTTGASFTCIASTGAGQLVIPPSVLSAMPAGGPAGIDFYPGPLPANLTGTALSATQLTFRYDFFSPLIFK